MTSLITCQVNSPTDNMSETCPSYFRGALALATNRKSTKTKKRANHARVRWCCGCQLRANLKCDQRKGDTVDNGFSISDDSDIHLHTCTLISKYRLYQIHEQRTELSLKAMGCVR